MTPYVGNDDKAAAAAAGNKQPKSIMVHPGNVVESVTENGDAIRDNLDNPDNTTDSIKPLMNGKGSALHNGHARGGKAALKRVSFGSSKGSMVETLVYDHNEELHFPRLIPAPHTTAPLHHQLHNNNQNILPASPQKNDNTKNEEELDTTSHVNGNTELEELQAFSLGLGLHWPLILNAASPDTSEEAPLLPSRVKVSFYESQKPNYVTTPESPDIPLDFLNLSSAMSTPPAPGSDYYERHESTDSGLDNPFRPDGELSREADTIVSLIKEGKPITPVKDGHFGDFPDGEVPEPVQENEISPVKVAKNLESNAHPGANGNTPKDKPPAPGLVEVQHGIVVPPSDASQVEQVVIKKKPKCKCCVIQ